MYGFLRFIAPKWNFLHWPDAWDGITGPDFHKTLEGNTLQCCQLYLSNFCPKVNNVPSITVLLKLYRIGTVWKFDNFPATLNLREINFG